MRVGGSVKGYKKGPDIGIDDDYFRTHLTDGQTYRFEVRGAADPNDPNDEWTFESPSVFLQSLTESLAGVTSDDPSNGENAVLEYEITTTGTYVITANPTFSGTPGTYQLKVTDITQ